MTIQDTCGNLHAHDGKFATKNKNQSEATGLELQAPTPMSFHLAGARDINLNLGDDFELPPYPAGYPAPVVDFVQADSGEWQTHISDGQDGFDVWLTWDADERRPVIQEMTYDPAIRPEFADLTDGEEEFDAWAGAVHRRALTAMDSYTFNSVPNGLPERIAAFASGDIDKANDDGHATHQARYAADLGHALSGCLIPDQDPEEATHNIGYALAGIRHWCKANGHDFEAPLASGMESFEADTLEDAQVPGD